MNIFVGNLSYRMQENELEATFALHGDVQSAKIVLDRESGRSRGFGFVEMPNAVEGKAAINALNGQEMGGRSLVVNEAKPRQPGAPRRREH
ncbi:RNA recognition motif domain-containing protein [Pontibacterium sp.]|uniref:RNA recognition motif domain-containing protein n=1 Tax=Pontibacterium sp. TaxID=2036026 RepID=UPI003562A57C